MECLGDRVGLNSDRVGERVVCKVGESERIRGYLGEREKGTVRERVRVGESQ